MNTGITTVNSKLFLELSELFDTRAKNSKFPMSKIHNKSSSLGNEFLLAEYRYHEDGAVHCTIKIWTEDDNLLFKSSTSLIKNEATVVTEEGIGSLKQAVGQFFDEFNQKYKN